MTEVGSVLSVEELLARSAEAVRTRTPAGGSKVQQLLAGREEDDSVDLSPVAKLLDAKKKEDAKTAIPFTEQDWYIRAKVTQLRAQIQIYSNLPGLDPSGAIMDSLSKEVTDLVSKQNAKLKKSQAESAAKQKELDEKNAAAANAPMSADEMLKRAKLRASGADIPVEISKDVQKLLDESKGKLVDQSA